MPLGHEFSGIVDSIGDNIKDIEIGQKVAIDPVAKENLIGCSGTEGGFAEYLRVKQAEKDVNVFCLPNDFNLDYAALVEPLSVAMHAVNIVNPQPGEKVTVLGTGPIGLGVVAALKARGIADIAAVDTSDFRLQLAKQQGAKNTHNATTGLTSHFLKEVHGTETCVGVNGVGTDVYIDAVA
jgi:(R,R)-butanediol dehydrogenase/meso-butanediol dehydrogenase/diacetyl reductase